MSRFLLSLSVLALMTVGCDDNSSGNTQAYQQTSVRAKPIVAIVPVIDNTKNHYEWDLSDEFSSALHSRLAQRGHLLITDVPQVRAKIKKLTGKDNPFGSNLSWIQPVFQGDQFVVFLELVEHEEVINQNRKRPSDPKNCNADLNISMRVRAFDVRGETPKVILQELIHDTHFIPRAFTQENFYQVPWGDASYSISPIGIAHDKFTRELSERIEDYILMALN
jgi:hypothetical protein